MRILSASLRPGWWLDICSGTGETAALLSRYAGGQSRIISADFSPEMLRFSAARNSREPVFFSICDALSLPFPSDSLNAVTISFATRNIHSHPSGLESHFREFYRVLKPGGVFMNLETSRPQNPLVRRLFHLYIRKTVLPLGRAISGSSRAYSYLSSTIPRFLGAPELKNILQKCGFFRVEYDSFLFGAAAAHRAYKS